MTPPVDSSSSNQDDSGAPASGTSGSLPNHSDLTSAADRFGDEDLRVPFQEDLPQLAGYEILQLLGAGASGTVFLAVQSRLGRKVAIKRLDVAGVGQAKLARRFRREARTLAALDHPNIVRLYDFIEDGSGHYLVMEFVDGPTLRNVQPALTPATGLGCIRQLSSAISYASSRGVVHRDIKPENVLVAPGGIYKLADFGIAKILSESLGVGSLTALATQAGDIMGTAAYISPEAAAGRLDLGSEADVYSLGVMAYEFLVGRLPFQQTNIWEMLLAHESEPPPHPTALVPGFPLRVEAVLLAALEKDPKRRTHSAALFCQQLGEAPTAAWPEAAGDAVGTAGSGLSPPAVARAEETARAPGIDPAHEVAKQTVIVPDPRCQEASLGGPPPVAPLPSQAPSHAFRPGGRRTRRAGRAVAAVIVAVVVAAIVVTLVSQRSSAGGRLAIVSVSLSVAPASTGHCPSAMFDFQAQIKTNGRSGELSFRWQRPDGTDGPAESRALSSGTMIDAETLQFTFSGSGSTTDQAVLHVISPANVYSPPVTVRYQCP